jgi:hypothetical protein
VKEKEENLSGNIPILHMESAEWITYSTLNSVLLWYTGLKVSWPYLHLAWLFVYWALWISDYWITLLWYHKSQRTHDNKMVVVTCHQRDWRKTHDIIIIIIVEKGIVLF